MHTETMAEWLGRTEDGLWEVKVYPFQQDPFVESFVQLRDAEMFLYQYREVSHYHG